MIALRGAILRFVLALLLLLIVLYAGMLIWTGPQVVIASIRHFGTGLFAYAGGEAIRAWEAGGSGAIREFEARMGAGRNLVFLFDAAARPVSTPAPDPSVVEVIRQARNSGRLEMELGREAVFAGLPVGSREGGQWLVGFRLSRQLSLDWARALGTFLPRTILGLLVVAVFSTWFAYRLSTPLLRLREAARSFAAGTLSARVDLGERSARIREFGELAGDFNDMAARIEHLIASQQRLLQYVSHELRTPLTRLSLAVNMARSAPNAPGAGGPLDRVDAEVNRLNGLIDRILTLNHLQTADRPYELRVIDMADFLDTIVADTQFEASAYGKNVVLAGNAECRLTGDRETLRGAFENVIRNAVRHTVPGSTVTVDAVCERMEYVVRVVDEGGGVPPGSEGSIFEPFVRIKGEPTTGYGLGLTIAKRSMELHGGSIEAANAGAESGGEPSGLAVTMRLPLG